MAMATFDLLAKGKDGWIEMHPQSNTTLSLFTFMWIFPVEHLGFKCFAEVIQAEVLSRLRHSQGEVPPELRDAMIISIQGIAAGMQNTG